MIENFWINRTTKNATTFRSKFSRWHNRFMLNAQLRKVWPLRLSVSTTDCNRHKLIKEQSTIFSLMSWMKMRMKRRIFELVFRIDLGMILLYPYIDFYVRSFINLFNRELNIINQRIIFFIFWNFVQTDEQLYPAFLIYFIQYKFL